MSRTEGPAVSHGDRIYAADIAEMAQTSAPTVVLVHGAFADASSHAHVIPAGRRPGRGGPGRPEPQPDRRRRLHRLPSPPDLQPRGPRRPLLRWRGHHPGRRRDNVQARLFAGYALAEGERLGELRGRFLDSDLDQAPGLQALPREGADDGTDDSVDGARFPAIFATDVARDLDEVLAVSQRPLAAQAFTEAAPTAAWKTKPAWGLVAMSDHTINPEVASLGYERAGMPTIEVDSSHLVMLPPARPSAVNAVADRAPTRHVQPAVPAGLPLFGRTGANHV
jgi:hypothetical protein